MNKEHILSSIRTNKKYGSDKENEISSFVDDLFFCFEERGLLENGDYGNSQHINGWRHFSHHELMSSWKYMIIDRQSLQSSLSNYIKNDILWCEELDWLFVDSLIFAELIATQRYYCINLTPARFMAFSDTSRIFSIKYFLWAVFRITIKVISFLFLAYLFYNCSPYVMYLYIFFILILKIINYCDKRKKLNQLGEMGKTYIMAAPNLFINWRILRNKMDIDRRNFNIAWDNVLYNLIDLRLS